jgi:hypothetical protein
MSFCFFNKIGEQEGRTSPVWVGRGVGTSMRGEDVEKGCRRVNIVQILCTCCVNGKMRPVKNIPGVS